MKIKNKGKVYPSPSSSSFLGSASSSSSRDYRDGDDFLSVLKLLPATILTLASVLSLQDREVLAYMITRSLKTTTNPTPKQASLLQGSKKKSTKNKSPNTHKSPSFDCDCFDCYTSYWFRWDSSPNRELIHQVIEAFEEHLSNGELFKKTSRGKRRDKTGRRVGDKSVIDVLGRPEMQEPEATVNESSLVGGAVVSPNDDVSPVVMLERAADGEEVKGSEESPAEAETEEMAVVARSPPPNNHKGLARKVLPDVLGLFNSRLWNLWNPNV
ncbi:uncharacterized protein LOC8286765 [Ricinus communis]|uniref:Uncharacterized protein n=1 Tax=Ricinus communis TaxID=3988 RepID=B9RMB4_RICCO|nr:uncharacterized protein LOC8286765 [Ricinus communis]EEF47437.1 conserved hypothetical protein [Ricinus communis]|eukprot:XP_002514883.1 uncharacterized protein LOC8286765 [Ricinus communis]